MNKWYVRGVSALATILAAELGFLALKSANKSDLEEKVEQVAQVERVEPKINLRNSQTKVESSKFSKPLRLEDINEANADEYFPGRKIKLGKKDYYLIEPDKPIPGQKALVINNNWRFEPYNESPERFKIKKNPGKVDKDLTQQGIGEVYLGVYASKNGYEFSISVLKASSKDFEQTLKELTYLSPKNVTPIWYRSTSNPDYFVIISRETSKNGKLLEYELKPEDYLALGEMLKNKISLEEIWRYKYLGQSSVDVADFLKYDFRNARVVIPEWLKEKN